MKKIKNFGALNKAFKTRCFKQTMDEQELYTAVLGINSRSIQPGRNNLKILEGLDPEKIKITGTLNSNNKRILEVKIIKDGGVLRNIDLNVSDLYLNLKKGRDKQIEDLKNGVVEFKRVPGTEVFLTKSRFLGFLII